MQTGRSHFASSRMKSSALIVLILAALSVVSSFPTTHVATFFYANPDCTGQLTLVTAEADVCGTPGCNAGALLVCDPAEIETRLEGHTGTSTVTFEECNVQSTCSVNFIPEGCVASPGGGSGSQTVECNTTHAWSYTYTDATCTSPEPTYAETTLKTCTPPSSMKASYCGSMYLSSATSTPVADTVP